MKEKRILKGILFFFLLLVTGSIVNASSISYSGPWTTSGTGDSREWVLSGDPTTGGYEFDVRGLDNSSWNSVSRDVYTLASVFDGTQIDNAGNTYYIAIWLFGPNWFPDYHGKFRLRINMNNQSGSDSDPNAYEEDTRAFDWNPETTYHVRVEWDTQKITLYIDGREEQAWNYAHTGEQFNPTQTLFRIGSMHWGSGPGLTYSNVYAWIGEPKEPVCGDGIVDLGEECDDGNIRNGDGCSSTCQWEHICGNGILEHGEECDDGNTQNGDGCSSLCEIEIPQPVPGLEAPFSLNAFQISPNQVKVTWQESSTSEDGFKIERLNGSWSQIATVGRNTTTYTDYTISPNTNYSYRVRAYDGGDNSDYSNISAIKTDASSGNVDLVISNINAVSGKNYFSAYVREGNQVYFDRTLTIVDIPSQYEGLLWIKTANDDKLYSSPVDFLTYTVDRGVIVYVGYDQRLNLPSWLSDWTNAGDIIQNSDMAGKNTFRIYSKQFPQGTVRLGPNDADTDSSSMYIVLNKNLGGGPVCGNNVLDIGEECDDGNLVNNDGCSSVCRIESGFEPAQSVGISGDRFTLNGEPKFLLGASLFDALNWSESAMESDMRYLKDNRYNLIRVWADWNWQNNRENEHSSWQNRNSTVYNLNASLNSRIEKLKTIIEKASEYGLLVDLVIEDTNPWFYGDGVNFNERLVAAENITNALKGYKNIFFDICNEHNHDGTDFYPVSHNEAKQIADRVRAVDSGRIVTISSTGKHIISGSEQLQTQNINEEVLDVGVNVMTPHFYRSSDWYSKTTNRITDLKTYLRNSLARNIPVYLQEENYYPGGDSNSQHFVDAATRAKNAGAAGWVFHQVAGFDLKNGKSFQNELASGGRSVFEQIGNAVGELPPSTKTGDLNNDSRVDIIDLGILLSNWGSTLRPPADINQDGYVDIIDLGILLSNWG